MTPHSPGGCCSCRSSPTPHAPRPTPTDTLMSTCRARPGLPATFLETLRRTSLPRGSITAPSHPPLPPHTLLHNSGPSSPHAAPSSSPTSQAQGVTSARTALPREHTPPPHPHPTREHCHLPQAAGTRHNTRTTTRRGTARRASKPRVLESRQHGLGAGGGEGTDARLPAMLKPPSTGLPFIFYFFI